jgi:hypothetical protein
MDEISAIKGVTGAKPLTPDQEAKVRKLAARDRDVRAHEAAHLAAAGALAGGVDYTYEIGPDGKLYAVGGQTRISIPAGLSPEQRLVVARDLLAAAEAPVDPSGQEMAMASRAARMEAEAMQKIAEDRNQPAPALPGSGSPDADHGLDRMA